MPSITWTSNRFSKNLNHSELGGSLNCLTLFFVYWGMVKNFMAENFVGKKLLEMRRNYSSSTVGINWSEQMRLSQFIFLPLLRR